MKSAKELWTHERERSKSRDVSEKEQYFTIKRRFDSIDYRGVSGNNAEVEDLFRQILQRVEEELILDQFRNL